MSRTARRRACVLIGVHIAIAVHYAHWKFSGRTLAPLELNEAVFTAAEGVVTAGFLLLVVLTLVSAIVGRFFCSWGCHLLALQDLAAWLLERVGIRPRPVRSRVLAALPFAVAAYMFVWPLVYRAAAGIDVDLHYRAAGSAWSSFMTENFTRNLPSWPVALVTLAVCGFASVYWMGSRAFCSHACPYGALFGLADRIAPGRIVARGDCSDCGACTAACQSHISVHRELSRFGTVVNSACLRDLDCVAACPDGRVQFGIARPPLFRNLRRTRALPRKWDASGAEECLLMFVVVLSVFALRGLFGVMPLLLTVTTSALLAFGLFVTSRILRGRRVRALGTELRSADRITRAGTVWIAVTTLAFALTAENATVRIAQIRGARSLELAHTLSARSPTVAADAARDAHAMFRLVERFSIDPPNDLRERFELAERLSSAATASAPRNHAKELESDLAQIERCASSGRLSDALALATKLAANAPEAAIAHYQHGVLLAANGRETEALAAFERCVALAPNDVDALNNFGFLLLRAGRGAEAGPRLLRATELAPDHAAARFNLGSWLLLDGQTAESVPHLEAARRLDPTYGDAVEELLGSMRTNGAGNDGTRR